MQEDSALDANINFIMSTPANEQLEPTQQGQEYIQDSHQVSTELGLKQEEMESQVDSQKGEQTQEGEQPKEEGAQKQPEEEPEIYTENILPRRIKKTIVSYKEADEEDDFEEIRKCFVVYLKSCTAHKSVKIGTNRNR